MSDQKSIDLTNKKCVVLLGAGISKEAGFPLAHDLLNLLIDNCLRLSICERKGDNRYAFSPDEARLIKSLFCKFALCDHEHFIDYELSEVPTFESFLELLKTLSSKNIIYSQLYRDSGTIMSLIRKIKCAKSQPESLENGSEHFEPESKSNQCDRPSESDSHDVIPIFTDADIFESLHRKFLLLIKHELSNPDRIDYYRPFLTLAFSTKCDFYTLNYDTLLEQTFEPGGSVNLTDQIQNFYECGLFSERYSNRLFKLHGSVNYLIETSYGPHSRIRIRTDGASSGDHAMILGVGKMEYLLPFPLMYSEFCLQVLDCDVLICLGYSGSDKHINEPIFMRALKENFHFIEIGDTCNSISRILSGRQSMQIVNGQESQGTYPQLAGQSIWYCDLSTLLSDEQRLLFDNGKITEATLASLETNLSTLEFRRMSVARLRGR